ncbi:CLIP domain-containing serine protease 2 [Papilio machaon]|uniref:CLIP domain-containing serine protease 2 n=1 Tax=Papilio machaon TaxID=76193 RepID=UPI001E662DA8|nr:CLIP domain-containing serine protease 2 [Papilio machaon]XP_045537796.1 CLIP domain-containing serine protease 2 [Papilio machaon]
MRSHPTVLFCVLFAALTAALKQCDDCVKITDCASAIQLLHTDRSAAAIQQLRNALCGFESVHKVCCSDFLPSRFDGNYAIENNALTSGDEIENHRNIRLLPTECGDVDGNRIIGGTSAGLYEFPWLALISYRVEDGRTLKFKCGGSVITARYVLTAAHCIYNQQVAAVRIGDYDISQPVDCVGEDEIRECESKYQDIAVTHQISHPKYVIAPISLNDIGLLRLATPVDFSYRNSGTICLPIMRDLREMDIAQEFATVAGWGATENQKQSNILLKVRVPIYPETTCVSFYKRAMQSRLFKPNMMMNTICAGDEGRDSCKGDSGGPLMIEAPYNGTYKFVQFGIVSYGFEQCGLSKPGMYTDVRKYMKWILDTIKP